MNMIEIDTVTFSRELDLDVGINFETLIGSFDDFVENINFYLFYLFTIILVYYFI
jgi:hypothetical protein